MGFRLGLVLSSTRNNPLGWIVGISDFGRRWLRTRVLGIEPFLVAPLYK